MGEYNHSSSRRRASNTNAARRSSSAAGRDTRERLAASSSRDNYAAHSAARRSAGSGHRHRRKGGPDITQILMYVIGAIIIILCISLIVKGCGKMAGKGKESAEASSESASAEESKADQVTVDGIDITGMSQSEARAAILKQYDWEMKVTYEDKEAAVNNLMEDKVDELLEEIYAGDKKDAFEVNTDNMIEAAKAEAALIAGNWNLVAKNGGISGYDKDTGKFTFTEGSNGVVIDQDKLAQAIVDAIHKKEYKSVIKAEVKQVSPDMTAAQLKEKYKTIATYTTKTTSNSNRNENIRLACNALNGAIVNPGQEFSFNDTTGARTEAKGYKPATAYLNGEIVQEPGGGVCQISSTLYNAVIFAGLKSTERHAHSYEPSYVTPGEDAAVSFGGPDFKFVNNSDYPVAIKTSFAKQELTISIYGVPLLKDGEKIRMSSEKVSTLDPPAPTYEEDPYLQLDEEKVAKDAVPGSSWKTYLVKYEDGKEAGREFFHNSSYRGKAAIIKRNTSGVVLTTEASTEAPIESSSVEETIEGQGPAGPGGEAVPSQPAQTVPVSPENPDGGPGQQPGQEGVPSANGAGDASSNPAVTQPFENPVVGPGPGSGSM